MSPSMSLPFKLQHRCLLSGVTLVFLLFVVFSLSVLLPFELQHVCLLSGVTLVEQLSSSAFLGCMIWYTKRKIH